MEMKKFALGFGVAMLMACGGGGGDSPGYSTGPSTPPTNSSPPPGSGNGSVTVVNNAFNPADVIVAPGSSVTWHWNTCDNGYPAQSCVAHSVTFDDGTASPTQESGTFTRTFATAGTYNYHCAVHGALMTGSVKVQ